MSITDCNLQYKSEIWNLPVVLYCHVRKGPDSPNSKLSCYPWILLELTLRPFSTQKLIFGAYCILTKEIILGEIFVILTHEACYMHPSKCFNLLEVMI